LATTFLAFVAFLATFFAAGFLALRKEKRKREGQKQK